jgi:hypothetical protein
MRRLIVAALSCAGVAAAIGLSVVDLAFAADRIPRGGPAPLLGVGLPLIGGVLATVFVVRRFRRKD